MEEDHDQQQEVIDEPHTFLPADHPLLGRLQAALTRQLTDEHERVDIELTANEQNLKKIEYEKENIGVKLYAVQQQLAESQIAFEQTHENFNLVQKLRQEVVEKHDILNDQYQKKKNELEELRKKLFKAQDELSKLNRTLKEIADHNEQMVSAIAVTRTGTLRAEENVVSLEKNKKKQDHLIDSINEEIKRKQEQKTVLTAQLQAQREERQQAIQILKEAETEMANIIASKKNLLEKWQKALFNIQRRDNALQAIKEALRIQKEISVEKKNELVGIQQEIRQEGDITSKLTQSNEKLEYERRYLKNELKKLEHQQSKLQAQIQLLTKSLQSTEEQTKSVEIEQRALQEQMNQIESNIMKLHTETMKLNELIINDVSEYKTIEKTALNLTKQADLIALEIDEKEVDLENLLNEIARVQIDKLNTTAQIELLVAKKREVIAEKEDKEKTVAKYEVEIRQGHDLNEKKQHEVGRLNKIHDTLKNSTSDTVRGPLESTKSHLKTKTAELKNDIEQMQNEWLKKQTNLVDMTNENEKISEEVAYLKTKQTILEQKKLRLKNAYIQHEKEISEIKNDLKNLQTEMNRLNDRIADNRERRKNLENENINIESEFIEKLKDMEKESVYLEVEMDRIKDEKAQLLSEIVEAEKQILLWERKINLEREMQETLDPNYGQKEIQELKKEIHRMELRLDDIRKKQENVILEMERAVYKRETIQLKYIDKDKQNEKNTPQQAKAQIQNLRQTLDTTTKNIKIIEQGLNQKISELDQLNQQIDEQENRYNELQQQTQEATNKISEAKIMKNVNTFKILKKQCMAKKYDELTHNTCKLTFPESQLRSKFNEQVEKNNQIKSTLEKILQDFPHYDFLLKPLLDL